MGMTLTEKILARHAGMPAAAAGANIWLDVDVLMTHDVCGPGCIGIFKDKFGKDAKVWDKDRVVIIPDHYIFTASKQAHRNIGILRDFVKEQGLKYYYDPDFIQAEGMPSPYADPSRTSYKGVCHIALPEEGHTRPGEVLLGTDSHTCTAGAFGQFATGVGNTDAAFVLGTGKTWLKVPPSMRFILEGELPPHLMAKDIILAIIGDIGVSGATYKAMEYAGEGLASLTMEDRMTLCNMAIEAGGKNGIIPADQKTIDYVNERIAKAGTRADYEVVHADPDAKYCFEKAYDLSSLEPMVAKPHSPDNKAAVREVEGTKLTRAYIGSCTGGKVSDFVAAAKVLAGHECRIPTFIVPATTEVDAELDRHFVGDKTLRQVFQDCGAVIGPASCAACLGGPADTLGRLNDPDEVCISATNRNFPGRMGDKQAQVYLASPLTVAASAISGVISDPREHVGGPVAR